MIELITKEIPICFYEEWNNRITLFQNNETVLPSWLIRFHCCTVKQQDFEIDKVGETESFCYYKVGHNFWIFEHNKITETSVCLSSNYEKVDVYYPSPEVLDESALSLICQAYKYRALVEHSLLLHSSSIVYKGNGVLFFGHSGAGKSTQADLWNKYLQAEIINYDHNFIYLKDNNYMISSTPWGGKEKYYINKRAPLKYIVFVQKSENDNVVELLDKANAFSALYLHNYVFPFDSRIEETLCNTIQSLILRIPVFRLRCTSGKEGVLALYRALYER